MKCLVRSSAQAPTGFYVIDTSEVGYKVSAEGYDESTNSVLADTREIESFNVKHLITYQGDLNYDGRIGMKDLVALDAGVRNSSGSLSHDVDANYDGKMNMEDLSILDADWGSSLHFSLGDKQFLGSDQISMDELLSQGERRWNSSNFAYQNSLERDESMSTLARFCCRYG